MTCSTCEVNHNCELQTVANDLGINEHRYNKPNKIKELKILRMNICE